jgi:hypothetical protein
MIGNTSSALYRLRSGCSVAIFSLALAANADAAVVTPAFVQMNAGKVTTGTVNTVPLASATHAGDTLVVFNIVDTTSGVSSVTDTQGNTFHACGTKTLWNGNRWSAQILYADNIHGGADAVTAHYAAPVQNSGGDFGIVYAHEYSGVSPTSACIGFNGQAGSGTAAMSGGIAVSVPSGLGSESHFWRHCDDDEHCAQYVEPACEAGQVRRPERGLCGVDGGRLPCARPDAWGQLGGAGGGVCRCARAGGHACANPGTYTGPNPGTNTGPNTSPNTGSHATSHSCSDTRADSGTYTGTNPGSHTRAYTIAQRLIGHWHQCGGFLLLVHQ